MTTEPPPRKSASVPSTAADADADVGLSRDLRIQNNTDRDREMRIVLPDTELYRGTVAVGAGTEPWYRDLIGKQGRQGISFERAVCVSRTDERPVDADSGDSRAVIGGDPVNPTVTFRIDPL